MRRRGGIKGPEDQQRTRSRPAGFDGSFLANSTGGAGLLAKDALKP